MTVNKGIDSAVGLISPSAFTVDVNHCAAIDFLLLSMVPAVRVNLSLGKEKRILPTSAPADFDASFSTEEFQLWTRKRR